MKDRFCLRKRSAPRGPHVITHSATLDVPAETATLLTELLVAERLRRGTGVGTRAASARDQAILVLRWFREDADLKVLAADTRISLATGYRYLHEGIDVLAAQAPDLHQVLAAGAAAGWTHVTLDGTLIRTDRCRTVNPVTGHDLWYSGKHRTHGGNVQIIGDPTGFPVAVLRRRARLDPRPHRRPRQRLPRRAARRGRPAGPPRAGRQGLRRRRRGHPHAGQGRRAASRHRRPQRADRLPPRRGRAGHRAAQDPLEGAAPYPSVSSTNRCRRRRRPCPHLNAARPLVEGRELARWRGSAVGRDAMGAPRGFPPGLFFVVSVAGAALRFQLPPVNPCMRFSRTRLTDAVHRRHSACSARACRPWVRRRFRRGRSGRTRSA